MLRSIGRTVKQAVVLVALLFAHVAFAQFRTVTVQNAPDNPVPTTIQTMPAVTINGTVPVNGNVNVTNEPTVKVDTSGPLPVQGTVTASISNEPTVKVDTTSPLPVSGTVSATILNAPTVKVDTTSPLPITGTVSATILNEPLVKVDGILPVTVTGTPAVSVTNLPLGVAGPQNTTVVLVKNIDSTVALQPLQPFQIPFTCTTTAPNGSCTSSFNIPQGKIFVAEYMQATAQESPAVALHYYSLQTTSGGQTMNYTYEPGLQIVGPSPKTRTSEHLMKIYADAGSTISLSGFSDVPGIGAGNAGVNINVIVSGHLENVQ